MSAGILFAALCQGMTGFGFALLGIPVLANFMGMKEAIVAGTCLCFIHYVLLAVRSYKHLCFRMNVPILVSTLIGMCLGLSIFVLIDEGALKLIAGAVICCSGILLIRGRFPRLGDSRFAKVTVGISGGLLETTTGMGGPPYVIYYVSQHQPADQFRGRLVSILVIICGAAFVMLALTPAARHLAVRNLIILLLPLIAGYELGVRLSKVISDRHFRIMVHILIIISGIALILSSYRAGAPN